MAEKIRTVRLYGALGTEFGRVHKLAVDSAVEAVRALCVLFPNFQRTLNASSSRGIAYACFIGKKNIGEDALKHPVGDADIRIAPVIAGSKRAGVFQTILGVVIIVAAAIYGAYTGDWADAGKAIAYGAAIGLGGVVQLLSPQQRGLSAKDSPNNGASYNFNGPVNTTAQGNPVPLLYGEMITGSAVVSAGIYAEDQV